MLSTVRMPWWDTDLQLLCFRIPTSTTETSNDLASGVDDYCGTSVSMILQSVFLVDGELCSEGQILQHLVILVQVQVVCFGATVCPGRCVGAFTSIKSGGLDAKL